MWNDEAHELVGAYRYCFVDKTIEAHGVEGSTATLYTNSKRTTERIKSSH